MPSCVNCGATLRCTCDKPEQPIGQTVMSCPKLAKGKLWIHVTDDLGANITKVPVRGTSEELTDSSGMAKFEELDPGTYTAAMKPSLENLKAYDISKKTELSKPVQIKAGLLAYVQFVLIRKAKLKVRFVVKSGAGLKTESPLTVDGIKVTAAYTGNGAQPEAVNKPSEAGTADFKVVSAGEYKVTPALSRLSRDDYEYVEEPREVKLEPGGKEIVFFSVVRKAKLTAKFVLKACGPTFPDDLPFKDTVIQVKAEPKAEGSKDSKPTVEDQAVLKVIPAGYTVTPEWSVLDDKLFEWKAEPRDKDVAGDDDDPVVFEIGRKAKLKVEIVYKHDADHHLRDKEDGIVPVKLEFLGNDFKPAATLPEVNTKEGIAEFATLSPGKYKITPDFTKLEKCKFDYEPETREVEIFPGIDEPQIFVVEPLYQKVHFIGHTLLTIPTQVFEPAAEDADKLTVTVKKDPAVKDAAEKAEKDYAAKEPAAREQAVNDRAAREHAAKERAAKDQAAEEQAARDKAAREQAAKERAAKVWAAEEQDAKEQDEKEWAAKDRAAEEQAAKDKAKREETARYLAAGDKAAEEQAAKQQDVRAQTLKDWTATYERGERTVAYNVNPAPGPLYSRADFKVALAENKAAFSVGPKPKLTFKNKPANQGGGPWTLADLHPDFRDETKIKYDPDWTVKFQNKVETYKYTDLKGVWKGRYHGFTHDKTDIDHRVAFVADTLEKAFAEADKDPTVLKVFMIPECFFQGVYGAYLIDDASILLTKLQELVAPAKWKDWVFSFGTVNSVFQALPPSKDIGLKREIYEMQNHAPVLRGGLGQAGGSDSTRMIQKLVNSAELADDLIPHPNPVRLQAINADVQFTGTENDEAIGKLLMKILNDKVTSGTLFKKEGLPGEWWPDLTAALEDYLGQWGLDRVVRAIRVVDNSNINSRPLPEWACVTLAPDVSKVSGIESMKAALPAIEREWQAQYSGLARSDFKTKDDARTRVLNAVIGDKTTPAAGWGLILPYQKQYVQSLIKTIVSEFDTLSKDIVSEFDKLDIKLGRKLTRLDLADGVAAAALRKTEEEAVRIRRDLAELENKPQILANGKLEAERRKEAEEKKGAVANVPKLTDLDREIKEIEEKNKPLKEEQDKLKKEIDEKREEIEARKTDFAEAKGSMDTSSREAEEKAIKELEEAAKQIQVSHDNVDRERRKNIDARLLKIGARDSALRYQAAVKEIEQFEKDIKEISMHPDKLKDDIEKKKIELEALGPLEIQGQALEKLEAIRSLLPSGEPAPKLNLSIFPIWKKLLELYSPANPNMELKKESMQLDDYCFAGPRKVGGWFGSLGEIGGKDACKVMVFCLEICADHAAFRVKEINKGASAVGIDIHLVPSAGMSPTYFASRQDGFIFNCDGWNKAHIKGGGGKLEVRHDGPSPFTKDGAPFSPTYPHTAVGKSSGAGKDVGACLTPVVAKVISAGLAKTIFECGEGELHVYPVQDLPK